MTPEKDSASRVKKAVKKEKWVLPRHRFFNVLFRPVFWLLCKLKYGLRYEKLKDQGKRNYLVVSNHQTGFDQFFIALLFKGPLYFVATEDIFSNGLSSSLIRYLVAPIPFRKSTKDFRSIMDMMQVAKEGGSICLFPEGNRTFSGKTCDIKPSVAHLAKKMKLPIAVCRIEDGYGVGPRWSNVTRSGHVHSYVKRVIEPEEYASLSNDELFELLKSELWVDESETPGTFKSRKSAEYLDRVFYVCPRCGLSRFFAKGKFITCQQCDLVLKYEANKTFSVTRGSGFSFRNPAEWYEYQEEFIRSLDLTPYKDRPLCTDHAAFSEIIPYKKKEPLAKGACLSLYGDRLEVSGSVSQTFDYDKVYAMAVMGRNKLLLYYDSRTFMFKGNAHFNALKFVNIYYHYANKGDHHGEFLGL